MPLASVAPWFDPFDSDYRDRPDEVLDRLRGLGNVVYAPAIDMHLVLGYPAISQILMDPIAFSSAGISHSPVGPLCDDAKAALASAHDERPTVAGLDPPEHERLRSPMVKAFSARRIQEMRHTIIRDAEELVDSLAATYNFDIVAEIARPLPARWIFAHIGFPAEDASRLMDWCLDRLELTWGNPSRELQVKAAQGVADFRQYCREFVERRVNQRADDMTSDLLDTCDRFPHALTVDDVVALVNSMSFAGHETTTRLISSMFVRLLGPDSNTWDEVRRDPSTIPSAIERVLGLEPPIVAWQRVTTRPVEVEGVAIPSGSRILLMLSSVGRSERAGIATPPPRHLSFGRGIHACPGASLARTQAEVVLEVVSRRMPTLELVPDQVVNYHPNLAFRGPISLLVRHHGPDASAVPCTERADGVGSDGLS
jgi:cytochrome P450